MRVHQFLVVFGILAATAAVADTKSEIQAAYRKMEDALRTKNIAGVMAMCTADFKWIDNKGQAMTRAQMEQQMKMQFGGIKKIDHVSNKVEKVTVKGNQATTRTNGIFEATLMLTPDAKKSSKLKGGSVTDDTWVKTPKGWMLKQVNVIKETMTLDGKPFSG